MRIALDAMGGDHAPGPIVAGAIRAAEAEPELHIVLVGDQAQVEPLLPTGGARSRLEIFHSTQVIGMDEKPGKAMLRKPDNSIKRCYELLASRKVDGIVSAGNTGAMVAGGHFLKLFLEGVHRPGIAAVLPTIKGPVVLLDVGANIQAKPEHLYQYAIMGGLYAHSVLGVASPRVGLMNVGEEEAKGHDLYREAHAMLSQGPLRDRFAGNVEGRDIHKGQVDVIVCDGFVGNVLLKYCEGVFEFLLGVVHRDLVSKLDAERSLGEQACRDLAQRYHYSTYGGAPLLGVNGACIICHGSSKERAIMNALLAAARYAREHLSEAIVKELRANPPPPIEAGV
jgi:phosphate acyltransferase